jgi:hypothetical protein
LEALRQFFGGADLGYTIEDFTDPRWVIQLGIAPIRIDLISTISGCPSFDSAWRNRVEGQFGLVKTYYLGLEDLIRAKETADRDQDRVDVRSLRKARHTAPERKRRKEK